MAITNTLNITGSGFIKGNGAGGFSAVTDPLPIANGGTAGATKLAGFDNLSPGATKGDLIVFNGTNNVVLGVGSNTQVLTADSTQTTGIKWAAASGGGSYADTVTTVTTDTSMAVNTVYLCNASSGTCVMTMPGTASVGARIGILGLGSVTYKVQGVSGTIFHTALTTSVTGVNAQLVAQSQYSNLILECTVANAEWKIVSESGGFWVNDSSQAGVTATWDPAHKEAGVTLSNGNLTATQNVAAHEMVFCTNSRASSSGGKYYFEITCTTITSYMMCGIDSANTDTSFLGSTSTGYGYYSFDGTKYNNSVSTAYGTSYASGTVVGVAVDMTNRNIYFSKNGTFQNGGDPTSGATGTGKAFTFTAASYYPAMSIYQGVATVNFGASSFVYAAPSGYSSWNASIVNQVSSTTLRGNYGGTAPNANEIGESLTSNIASGSEITLTSTVNANVTSKQFTAGTWLISGLVTFDVAATTTVSGIAVSVNASTATFTTIGIDYSQTSTTAGSLFTGAVQCTFSAPVQILTFSIPTTYYLNCTSTFAVSTCKAFGKLYGIRIA